MCSMYKLTKPGSLRIHCTWIQLNVTMLLFICSLGIIVLFIYISVNSKCVETYWKKRGLKVHEENKKLGVFWNYFIKDRAMFEIFSDIYKKYTDEPAIGMISFSQPTVFVKDITNVQHVLHHDFKSFYHKGIDVTKDDKLADNIFFTNGMRWKLMRKDMTPLFTPTKLKSMYYIIEKSGLDLIGYLDTHPEKLNGNIFDTLTTFCCAAIMASVFGVGTESIFDSPFLSISRKAVASTVRNTFRFSLSAISPQLFKALKMKLFGEHEDLFISVIKQTIRQREKENVKKHDFADTCVSLQKKGKLNDSKMNYELEPTDEMMAAQAFIFLVAGVELSATAMFTTLLELGRNPEIMQRVHEEIDQVFDKTHGQLSYDVITQMGYLENVLNEALRMYPPVGFMTRKCVEDTILPVGNIKIDKGTKVFIPVYDIHHDPKYFPNPEVFNPNRFNDSSVQLAYMPFGKGNRICIGARFASIQVKAGLVHLLRHFTPQTEIHGDDIVYQKTNFQVRPSNVDIKLFQRK